MVFAFLPSHCNHSHLLRQSLCIIALSAFSENTVIFLSPEFIKLHYFKYFYIGSWCRKIKKKKPNIKGYQDWTVCSRVTTLLHAFYQHSASTEINNVCLITISNTWTPEDIWGVFTLYWIQQNMNSMGSDGGVYKLLWSWAIWHSLQEFH